MKFITEDIDSEMYDWIVDAPYRFRACDHALFVGDHSKQVDRDRNIREPFLVNLCAFDDNTRWTIVFEEDDVPLKVVGDSLDSPMVASMAHIAIAHCPFTIETAAERHFLFSVISAAAEAYIDELLKTGKRKLEDPKEDVSEPSSERFEHLAAVVAGDNTAEQMLALSSLVHVANEAYGNDGVLLDCWSRPGDEHGDGLASFIVAELEDAVRGTTNTREAFNQARALMITAKMQVASVVKAFEAELLKLDKEGK